MRSKCAAQFFGNCMPDPLGPPIFDIEQRGIGGRQVVAARYCLPSSALSTTAKPFSICSRPCSLTFSWSDGDGANRSVRKKPGKALGMDRADNVFHRPPSPGCRLPRLSGSDWPAGFSSASQRAMTGNSVRIEPSSRSSVGTFDFAFNPVKGGLYCAPSRKLTARPDTACRSLRAVHGCRSSRRRAHSRASSRIPRLIERP